VRAKAGPALYDRIGIGYRSLRRPDPRIAAQIERALDRAESVVNVGAGPGSYEPASCRVVPIEISRAMIAQRGPECAPAVQATAAALPLRDRAVEAGLAVLTIHHWGDDQAAGLAELMRVTRRRVVILTWDPAFPGFWLTDYFPDVFDLDRPRFPDVSALGAALGAIEVQTVPVPHDCSDGFLGAYWRRPASYLDPAARAAISTFTKLRNVEAGVEALARDLASGAWRDRYGEVLGASSLDLGYRLVIGGRP
jgi:SAM-dependent methyltransferase